ncbi:MAG TPA: leucyl/phenylalanyl-tRNA--protein transferase [Burkholderiaceae bacterium]|nr:leucyl/phenylalanyl-tRNA--protein transferase [Burkholderiaceae bacterium]
MIPLLGPDDPLPPVARALSKPNGLVAAGADLRPSRLLAAYRSGIFPWYGAGEPILWWSPDPRMVLAVDDFKLRASLRKRIRRFQDDPNIRLALDENFEEVIHACAEPREGASGTWILPEMQAAYIALHHAGYAHSLELRRGGQLIGGLYGVAIGRMFFGESMFTRESDASKTALAALVHLCRMTQMPWIDCQQQTGHLASLGALPIRRERFLDGVRLLTEAAGPDWAALRKLDLLRSIGR